MPAREMRVWYFIWLCHKVNKFSFHSIRYLFISWPKKKRKSRKYFQFMAAFCESNAPLELGIVRSAIVILLPFEYFPRYIRIAWAVCLFAHRKKNKLTANRYLIKMYRNRNPKVTYPLQKSWNVMISDSTYVQRRNLGFSVFRIAN